MIRLEEINEVLARAKSLANARRAYEAKRQKAGNAPPHKSEKVAAELATDAHHIETLEASLHAACVDAGLADLRSDECYEERVWRLSGWHESKWIPAQPKQLQMKSPITP